MTDDLVAFLRARLDEDERTARWAEDGSGACWEARFTDHLGEHMGLAEVGGTFTFTDGFLDVTFGAAEHAARHDPARVLAEVDAKLRIIDEHDTSGWKIGDRVHDCQWTERPCTTLRLLALPYAGHAEYRPEWRP